MQAKQSSFPSGKWMLAAVAIAGFNWMANDTARVLGNGSILLAGIGTLKRHENGDAVSAEPLKAYRQGLSSLMDEVQEIQEIVIKRLPEPLKDAVESAHVVRGDQIALMRELHKYSLMIIGQTNAGKTWFQQQSSVLTCEAIAKGGTGRIFDLTYGKRGHRWHGLPLGSIVFTEVQRDLPRLLQEAVDVRDTRRKEAREGVRESWPAYVLHIAEMNNSVQEYADWFNQLEKDEQQGIIKPQRLIYLIKQLLTDGHGYQVYLRVDAQTMAVGETGLNLAMLNQVNFCVRGSSAVDASELNKVLKDGGHWAERVAVARKQTGNDHISLAIVEKQPRLFIPPSLDAAVTIADQANRTELDEARLWVNGYVQVVRDAGGPTKAFEALKDRLPEGRRKQNADNPYYQAMKEVLSNEGINE